jgi:hypothetical protein
VKLLHSYQSQAITPEVVAIPVPEAAHNYYFPSFVSVLPESMASWHCSARPTFAPALVTYIPHTPLEDLFNGNHKQLRIRKGYATLQEPIKTTNMRARQEIARWTDANSERKYSQYSNIVLFRSISSYATHNKGNNAVLIQGSTSSVSGITTNNQHWVKPPMTNKPNQKQSR